MEKQRLWDWFDRLTQLWRKQLGQGRSTMRFSLLSAPEIQNLALALKTLHKGLAKTRTLPGHNYMDGPDSLGAYLHYYWPSSYAQTRSVVQRLNLKTRKRALDLGSGPGPASMALLDEGFSEVWAADKSRKALDFAEKAASFAPGTLHTFRWDMEKDGLFPQGRFDLIVLSHSWNELYGDHPDRERLKTQKILDLKGLLAPEGKILVIEPAQEETAQDLLRLRDSIIKEGWRVHSPCFFQGPCPLLAAKTPCFGDFEWDPPPTFTRLAHGARIERFSLKTSYLLMEPSSEYTLPLAIPEVQPPFVHGTPYRVVGLPLKNKAGRTRVALCGAGGRYTLSEGPDSTLLTALKRHEVVRVKGTEDREGGPGLVEGSWLQVEEPILPPLDTPVAAEKRSSKPSSEMDSDKTKGTEPSPLAPPLRKSRGVGRNKPWDRPETPDSKRRTRGSTPEARPRKVKPKPIDTTKKPWSPTQADKDQEDREVAPPRRPHNKKEPWAYNKSGPSRAQRRQEAPKGPPSSGAPAGRKPRSTGSRRDPSPKSTGGGKPY